MNIMALIELLDDELTHASSLPFTAKKLVDVDKCFDIISDLRINLPDDVKEAEQIVSQKAQILNEANAEAQRILDEAERRYNQMLDEHEITLHAEQRADEIIAKANAEAQDIRLGSISYGEEVLDTIEASARKILAQVEDNREQLQNMQ